MFLCVMREGNTRRVSFLSQSTQPLTFGSEINASPIFPVDPQAGFDNSLTPNCYILFCYTHSPFSILGRLCGKFNDDRIKSLWFCHGLASIILITQSQELINAVKSIIGNGLIASELWRIEDGTLLDVKIQFPVEKNLEIAVPATESLPPDIQALISEYASSIKTAMHRAASYRPEHLRILRDLHDHVCQTIEILLYFLVAGTEKPSALTMEDTDLQFVLTDLPARIRFVQSMVDRILQINSSLSYVITQAYTGITPILEHECPVRNFSLLGIGSAAAGLFKIYESVSRVFAKYPIPRAIRQAYETDHTAIKVFKNFADYTPDEWRKFATHLDGKLTLLSSSQDDQMFHLTYFSGQHAFRETLYGVSAAIQSLFVGATPRWTLLTLTHEYLHAHVRAIMGVLFPEESTNNFNMLFNLYSNLDNDQNSYVDANLRQRLALIVLTVLQSITESDILARNIMQDLAQEQKSIKLSQEDMLARLETHSKEIQEFIVHTLDYLYFYESNSELYIKLLWLTWSTIPEIQEKLQHYVLRTILAISVDMRGNLTERFNDSRKRFTEVLKQIISSGICSDRTIIQEAIGLMSNEKHEAALKARFAGRIRLVDMARYLLHSNNVHRDIKIDRLQTMDDKGNSFYPMEIGEFQDVDIQSPIAFIVDRAKRRLGGSQTYVYDTTLRETCWEFIVLCSTNLRDV